MNEEEGFKQVDTNRPFDVIDRAITKALKVLPWVALGMSITAVLILSTRPL